MTSDSDQYKTIQQTAEGLFKDKGSRFIAYAHPVENEEEIKTIISSYKRNFHDARHHCFAWELGVSRQNYRSNDDGEPSGTAGKPILGQIHSFGLTNILVVVVRYFGGTKLGVSGLINAYKEAAHSALNQSVIIEKTIDDYFQINFKYFAMNDVMKIIKEGGLDVISQDFAIECSLIFKVRQRDSPMIEQKFNKIEVMQMELLYTK
jgi:uncharacterized YigZ family protein